MRAGIAAGGVLVTVVLGVWAPGFLRRGLGHGSPEVLLLPTEPYVLIPVIALATAFCLVKRRRAGAVLCAAGTVVPVVLNSWVLKPLFDHHLSGYLAYPSGHTVSLVATLTVLVLLARHQIVAIAAAAAITTAAGIGLVEAGYHYPVDVVGGACFAVAAVLTLSLATTRLARAPSAGSPPADTSSGSPPAASPR
ncbi:phosphatase PAP2 family protein [Amycolatopsis alkalitolerans]|uniref:phosphatase PAP2 family protein n=1 Tax=Amycolatopsis alkalitolerans TaxID=2547244 RepID=UPI0013588048|nr:phosphatase PAP2 family protein [Amycolatopsis alkalitolerans]